MKEIRILFFMILLLQGCSSQTQLERLKVEELAVVPPVIVDSNFATVVTDTVIITEKIEYKDTVTVIKYYPQNKKFIWKVKPDTIKILKIDTVSVVEIKERKDCGVMMIWTMVLIVALIITIVFSIKGRS